MDSRIARSLTYVVLMLSLAVVSCGGDKRGLTGSDGSALITEVTVSPSEIRAGDEVSLTILIRNEGTQTIDLMFASGQQYDFLIENHSGVLGRHAAPYTMSTTYIRMDPGQSHARQFKIRLDPSALNYPVSWTPGITELPPGVYRIVCGTALGSNEFPWSFAQIDVVE